ncbi:hypothetical protein J6590_064593 [Homalodisca vitripennis]|nr:hypothetical protein J6590_064593 [Homalodisca vitripennis]
MVATTRRSYAMAARCATMRPVSSRFPRKDGVEDPNAGFESSPYPSINDHHHSHRTSDIPNMTVTCNRDSHERVTTRVTCVYRTVSSAVVMIVAGAIRLVLLTVERQSIFHLASKQVCQQKSNKDTHSRWTFSLVRDLNGWMNCGLTNVCLCQFLTVQS